MASIQANVEAVKAAVSSTSTCLPGTAQLLQGLLSPPNTNVPAPTKKPAPPVRARAKSATAKTPAAKARSNKKAEQENIHEDVESLSPKQRSILATEVINAALKALTDAIKTPTPVRRKESAKDLVKTVARRGIRRSLSVGQNIGVVEPAIESPRRTLDRSISSFGRLQRPSSAGNSGPRHTAECAQVAFACLRRQPPGSAPPLQLETGMSVLIGKLITLGLDDLAAHELRILRRRLDSERVKLKDSTVSAPSMAELLDFGKESLSGARLALVITTQLQILRVLISSPKQKATGNALLSVLQPSHSSSPTKLLLQAAKDTKPDKIARQLQSLSETLLALTPSVSPSDDNVAIEAQRNFSPKVALQLQGLALHNRILWWKIAGHKGDISKELFDPLLRCLSAFTRRTQEDALKTFHVCTTVYQDINNALSDFSEANRAGVHDIMSAIYKVFGSLALEANLIDQAIAWTNKIQENSDPKLDSDAKRCSIMARLVGLNLRKPSSTIDDEALVMSLLEGLERPFKGDVAEIEDLLTEASSVRRAAISLLSKGRSAGDDITDGMRDMCETLVFLCPRLSLRYLGQPPERSSSSLVKDALRYEQRRKFATKSGTYAIDSALFLVKRLLGGSRLSWDLIDSKLQDCLLLAERLAPPPEQGSCQEEPTSPSYNVRISNLYFSQYLNMRRDADSSKDPQPSKALKRSIDCIRLRPQHEKKAAQLSVKLERMAELHMALGRYDELFNTLLHLRDECIGNGYLTAVATVAANHTISYAWSHDDQATLLARTIQSLIKVQFKCLNPQSQALLYEGPWDDEEKGALLEHILAVLSSQPNKTPAVVALQVKIFRESLILYAQEKFPIRRLRVQTGLLSLDSEQQKEVAENIEGALQISSHCHDTKGTKDNGMREYLPHFESLFLMLLELQAPHPKEQILRGCLAVWSSIRKQCDTLAALERRIEDPSSLLVHLQLAADYMQMKGQNAVRIAILKLVVDLNELKATSSSPNDLVLGFSQLGAQWLQLGYSGKAGLAFDKADAYGHENGVAPATMLHLHLSYAEYMMAIGNYNKSEEHLLRAQVLHAEDKEYSSKSKRHLTLAQRTLSHQLISKAYLIYSMLALERGAPHAALTHAKTSVRLLRRAWATTEHSYGQFSQSTSSTSSEAEILAEEVSQLALSQVDISTEVMKSQPTCGSSFWPLVTPLFQGLFHLSELYAHHGMFQETLYYAEQAHQLVKEAGSEFHMAIGSASLGSICMRAGMVEKGSEYLMMAKESCSSQPKSREAAILAYRLGCMSDVLEDHDAANAAYLDAETILGQLTMPDFIDGLDNLVDPTEVLEAEMSKLTLVQPKTAPRKTVARSKAPVKCKLAPRAKSAVPEKAPMTVECPQLMSLRGAVLRRKARSLMISKKFGDALGILQESEKLSNSQTDHVDQGVASAKQLLLQSIEQMTDHRIYSVLQESTISFPAIALAGKGKSDKSVGDRLSVARLSPGRKIKGTAARGERARSKSPAPGSFVDKLLEAQEILIEVHSTALLVAAVDLIHTTSTLLNSVAMLLSAAGTQVVKQLAHPGFASCSIESVRTLALRRERKAILADARMNFKVEISSWPSVNFSDPRRLSLGVPHDLSRFQKEYIDIIPKAWTAISLSLSDTRNELSITKLQAGHTPFVLRLPLGRNNAIDADEDVFGYEQGHAELMEIIQLANESAHDARNMNEKEARATWWDEREALDSRLRELLENIEKVWLGGFTGIFSQHARRADLLARFQKSFHNILDRHLPSRQKTGKRGVSPRITLDSRILDLFIGLGDASAEDCDFSEPLADLLYFVVDVLQFHGEENAYAEIDFDTIVIETQDTLSSYYQAVHASNSEDEGRHTILILDKALHAFPWESLPCMDGMAVSRLASVGCLRDRILAQAATMPEDEDEAAPAGHYIPRASGAYILNPSGDLKSTSTTFSGPLKSLHSLPSSTWSSGSISKRTPTESEFSSALSDNELFLYFGHGSGAQYIRAKEIRRKEKCAVSLLWGCSSGEMKEAGVFESWGTPRDYLQAGAPGLVAVMWDVTDRDVDRCAKGVFENWGLFESKRKEKKGRKGGGEKERRTSLVEAVARARGECQLRYLTAAAVVVYGVPVYFK